MVSEWSHQVVRLSKQWRCPGWTLRWRSAPISPRKERIGPRREGFVHRKQCPRYTTKSFLDIICNVSFKVWSVMPNVVPGNLTWVLDKRRSKSLQILSRLFLICAKKSSSFHTTTFSSTIGKNVAASSKFKTSKMSARTRVCPISFRFSCKKKSFVGLKLMASHWGYLPFLPATPSSPFQTLAEL